MTSNNDTQDGTKGFSSQLSGNSKAGRTHTSSFGDDDSNKRTKQGAISQTGKKKKEMPPVA